MNQSGQTSLARPKLDLKIESASADLLIVDDTLDNVRVLADILETQGYSVRKALSGKIALKAVQIQRPDLVLLDVNMPELDGYDVCQQLKNDPETAGIPVIFLSAWSSTADKVKAFQVGGLDYITKPFQVEEVLARIKTHLTVRHLQSQLEQQNTDLRHTLNELTQTQTQLIQEQKMASLGRFVAGVAHEINNPINFITGNIEPANSYLNQFSIIIAAYQKECAEPSAELLALLDELDLDFAIADFKKVLGSIRHGADRIQQIVRALRMFTRIDEAGLKLFNLHEGIDHALTLLQHRVRGVSTAGTAALNIHIQKSYDQIPAVLCHPREINQAIFNLLDNAIDALGAAAAVQQAEGQVEPWQPTIWIRTFQDHNHSIGLSITDNGTGIQPEHLPRVFDPFFSYTAGDRSQQRLGLGLYTAYQIIVNHHSGRLTCQSCPNHNTEFVLALPVISNSGDTKLG